MISKVRILSRSDITTYRSLIESDAFAGHYGLKKTWICSACSTFEKPLAIRSPGAVQLIFDDVEAGMPNAATTDQIEQIAAAIRAAHADTLCGLFIAQCDGGRSRSGAIGTAAALYAGIYDAAFEYDNPGIYPNQYLLSELLSRLIPTQQGG